jgi:hypothetical protein
MALIVENGTNVAGAESYISVAEADSYHESRGNTDWDSVDDKEAALRKATDYMLSKYRHRWAGFRKTMTQTLDWPRQVVPVKDSSNVWSYISYYDNSIVPLEVKYACAILALKVVTAELLPDQTQVVLSETVGPITTVYDKNSPQATRYLEIDGMLRPYLKGNGKSVNMIRI